jgi:hypothetical protein
MPGDRAQTLVQQPVLDLDAWIDARLLAPCAVSSISKPPIGHRSRMAFISQRIAIFRPIRFVQRLNIELRLRGPYVISAKFRVRGFCRLLITNRLHKGFSPQRIAIIHPIQSFWDAIIWHFHQLLPLFQPAACIGKLRETCTLRERYYLNQRHAESIAIYPR